jgi:CelD/BcsL family acetyltransferase involved in cellulose biosynthesis
MNTVALSSGSPLDGGVDVICHRGATALTDVLPVWTALVGDHPRPPLFSRPAWALNWWSVYGSAREPICLEVIINGRPVALAILQLTRAPLARTRRLEFLGGGAATWSHWLLNPAGFGMQYRNDLLAAPGHEAAAAQAVVTWLARHSRMWDTVRLTALGPESPLPDAFAKVASAWRLRVEQDERGCIDTSRGLENCLTSLSKRQRRHLRYEPRALERAAGGPLELIEIRSPQTVTAMEDFIALHDRRWAAQCRPGLNPGEGQLYRSLAASDDPLFVVFEVRSRGRLLASQFGFDDGRRYLPYNSAFDPDLSAQSPSNVLIQMIVERCCRLGYVEVDVAGVSAGPRWTTHVVPRLHLEATSPRWSSRGRAAMVRVAGRGVLAGQRNRLGHRARALVAGLVAVRRRRADMAVLHGPVRSSHPTERLTNQ